MILKLILLKFYHQAYTHLPQTGTQQELQVWRNYQVFVLLCVFFILQFFAFLKQPLQHTWETDATCLLNIVISLIIFTKNEEKNSKELILDSGAVCIGTTTLGADPNLNNESLENNNGKDIQQFRFQSTIICKTNFS